MLPFYEKNANLFRFFSPENLDFLPHLHTQIEIAIIEKGEMEVVVNSRKQVLNRGDFLIIFPNQIHSYHTDKVSQFSRCVIAIFPVEMSGDFMSILMKQCPLNPFVKADMIHPDITYAIHSLANIQNKNEEVNLIKAYLHLILARVIPQLTLTSNRDHQPPGRTSQLISYISEYFCEPISLDTIAKHLGISKYSISRIFSEKLHTSFSQYVNALRINYAQTLLQGTDQDILSISMSCGYENSRTFNREFKKICDCTPREYRIRISSIQESRNLGVNSKLR